MLDHDIDAEQMAVIAAKVRTRPVEDPGRRPGKVTPSRDRDGVVAIAGDVGAWLQREHGLAIREIQVPEPYAHPHQWQADVLLFSLLAGGAAALLLSTILVAELDD